MQARPRHTPCSGPVRQAIPAILELIGKGLNKRQASATRETLPARWVELINDLNDVERRERATLPTKRGRHGHDTAQNDAALA